MPVKLFVTKFAPVQIALSRSATSAGVNFITWNKAYSIFPQATFLAYETVPLQPLNQALRGSLIKCSIRGWRMRTESLILAESEDSEQPLGNLRFKARSTGRGWGYEDHAAQL